MARFNLDIATPPENRTICSVPANDWARFVEPVTDLLPGDVLAQAAFTVKRSPADADTAGTSVQRIITAVAGTPGVIDQTKNILTFDFRPQDTALMLDSHFFDVQVWVARGADTFIKTIIKGRITSVADITNQTLLVGTGTTIDIVGDVPVTGDPGDFFQLVAEVRDNASNIIPGVAVTWDSSNPLIASVDAAGLVTIWNVGTCTITASAAAYSLSAIENVTSTDPSFIAATEGEVPVYRTGVWTPQLLTTLGTVTIGTWAATTIGPTHGGTGFGAFAVGDTLYADTTTSLAKRAIGSGGQFSVVSGGIPVWHTLVSADVTDATSANTPSTLIKRDGSGNFAAGTMTGSITGAAPAGSLSGTVLAATVVSSSLTSVGALASGSIVAGFGAIVVTSGTFSDTITVANGKSYAFAGGSSLTHPNAGSLTLASVNLGGNGNVVIQAASTFGVFVQVAASTIATFSSSSVSVGAGIVAGTDASFDIGASGANRFRDLFLSRNMNVAGTSTLIQAVVIGNHATSTLGDLSLDGATTTSFGPIIRLMRGGFSKGYIGTESAINSGNSDDIVLFSLNGFSVYAGNSAALYFKVLSTGAMTQVSTAISSFSTSVTGACGLQINNTNATNGGGVYISSASAPGTGFVLIDALASSTTSVFRVFGNGNAVNTNNSYAAISDARFKTILGEAGSQLDDFRSYKFRKYRIHSAPSANGLVAFVEPSAVQIGLVAQEVREVSPGLVDEDSNGFLSLKYSVLAVKNAKATQELIVLVDQLEARVQTLETQLKDSHNA